MKRFNCVLLSLLLAFTTAGIAAAPETGTETAEKPTEKRPALFKPRPLPKWTPPVKVEEDEVENAEEEKKGEKEERFWARMANRINDLKVLSQIFYDARVRPFIRNKVKPWIEENQGVIYGTGAALGSLGVYLAVKRHKAKKRANNAATNKTPV